MSFSSMPGSSAVTSISLSVSETSTLGMETDHAEDVDGQGRSKSPPEIVEGAIDIVLQRTERLALLAPNRHLPFAPIPGDKIANIHLSPP